MKDETRSRSGWMEEWRKRLGRALPRIRAHSQPDRYIRCVKHTSGSWWAASRQRDPLNADSGNFKVATPRDTGKWGLGKREREVSSAVLGQREGFVYKFFFSKDPISTPRPRGDTRPSNGPFKPWR